MIEQRIEHTIECINPGCRHKERREIAFAGEVYEPIPMWNLTMPASWTCPDCEAKQQQPAPATTGEGT